MSILGEQDQAGAAAAPPRRSVLFISHEKSDHTIAREIRKHLETGGFECWMAPDDIVGVAPWPQQVADAIDSCAVMLVVVSSNASDSAHVSREVDIAIEKGKALLPVRIEDIIPSGSLNYLLRLAQWIDVFPGPIADHAATLQAVVGSMLAESSAPARPASAPPRTTWFATARRWRAGIAGRIVWFVAVGLAIAVAFALGVALGGGDDQTATSVGTNAEDEGFGDVPSTAADPDIEPEPAAEGRVARGDDSTLRVSNGFDGGPGDGHSLNPDVSADGRFVVFDSTATNLVEGDTNGNRDVFLYDRDKDEMSRISQLRIGNDIIEADGGSSLPRISADGRYVVFVSGATNLVPQQFIHETGINLVFLHDRHTGTFELISKPGSDRPHLQPEISDDGTLIAYATYVDFQLPSPRQPGQGPYETWVYDVPTGSTTQLTSLDISGHYVSISRPSISPDGSVVIADRGDGHPFRFDRATGQVTEIFPGGDNGSFVAESATTMLFWTTNNFASNDLSDASDIYRHDWNTGEYTLVYEAAEPRSVSTDGTYLAATQLPERGHEPLIVNLDTRAAAAIGAGRLVGLGEFELSGDGRWVVLATSVNFVDGDSNNKQDVHLLRIDRFGE